MKSIPILILGTLLLLSPAAFAQTNRVLRPSTAVESAAPAEPGPRFNIDFPGGTPQQLIDAIEKQSGIHVNAVIPNESANYTIPALKMNDVTIKDLFSATKSASQRVVKVVTGWYTDGTGRPLREQFQNSPESAGFLNVGNVWYFRWDRVGLAQESKVKICRFYQLGPYLKNRKVEDITTAVQTGWKMLGETNLPELKYHQETQMLIAVGEENQLKLIDDVLEQLRFDSAPPNVAPGLPLPKPATNASGR